MIKEKKWKVAAFSGDWCPFCGSDNLEVFNESDEMGVVCDGDDARCIDCGCPGTVSVVEDPDAAWIDFHENLHCECEWCKSHQILE